MNPDVGLHACRCPPGTRGRFCEMTVAECGYPRGVWGLGCCANGGKCGILNTCECADGFTGPTCEIVVDQCIEVSSSKKVLIILSSIPCDSKVCQPQRELSTHTCICITDTSLILCASLCAGSSQSLLPKWWQVHHARRYCRRHLLLPGRLHG